MPSFFSSRRTSSHMRLASRTSQTEVTIGNIMPSLPNADARNRARSWVLKISGRVRQMRSARMPMAGLSSLGRSK